MALQIPLVNKIKQGIKKGVQTVNGMEEKIVNTIRWRHGNRAVYQEEERDNEGDKLAANPLLEKFGLKRCR